MCRNEGLRYIEYCIHHLHSDDTALHNLAVSLYAAKVSPPPPPPWGAPLAHR